MKTIKRDELKEKLDNNEVKLVDVLNEEDYNQEHIKGAINIPLERIGTEAKDKFNKDDQIVVYCSNFDCSASPAAAKKLDGLGFKNVFDYQGGKKDWKDAVLPME